MIRLIKCNHSSTFSYYNNISSKFQKDGFGAFILISSGKIPKFCARNKIYSIKPTKNLQDYAVIYISSTSGKYGKSSRIRYKLFEEIKHIYNEFT